jgi:predicted RNase H-like nuclease (RuvC/YqgF family)
MLTNKIRNMEKKTAMQGLIEWLRENKQTQQSSESGEIAIPEFDYVEFDDVLKKATELDESSTPCEELKSQNARLELSIEGMNLELEFKEKRISELESVLKPLLIQKDKRISELEREKERLKGLIKKAWFGNGMDCECESCTADFNKFKTENQL